MSDFHFGFLLLGPLLITSVSAVYGLQCGSYLRTATKSEMKFLAPRSIVVFPITLFAWIFWWCASPISMHLLLSGWRNVLSDPQATEWLTGSGLFLAMLYWAVLQWYGKICPLVLNVDRKIYRAFDVNSAILKTHTGSWEDIAGVYVNRASSKGSVIYYVRLKWQGKIGRGAWRLQQAGKSPSVCGEDVQRTWAAARRYAAVQELISSHYRRAVLG